MYEINVNFDPQDFPWSKYIPPGDNLLHGWQADIILYIALAPLGILCVYTLFKVYAVFRFLWVYFGPLDYAPKPGVIPPGEEPIVSILISCYNEAQVIRRTIDAAASVDWPSDKLEVCILDDSTDVTKEITDEAAADWQERGINCRVIRRKNREGYKAGNLHYAQDMITGHYHAMFDADHLATVDFLRKTMVHFYDREGNSKQEIGLVQTPWAYYNISSNMLTQCDALMLDVHHVIEQRGRGRALGMFSFNGTGGVWRKEAIASGGGWTWDTVTEDLDLSYRACLNGFRFVYVEDGPCALEIPANISAFKSQKYRWDQGYAQVTKKSLIDLLTYPGATFEQKIEVFFHLTGGIQYPLTLWLLLFVPVLSYFELMPLWALYCMGGIVGVILVQIILTISLKPDYKGDYTGLGRLWRYLYIIPSMMLNIGMSVNATMAVSAGYFKKGAVFIRTPKEGCAEGAAEHEPINSPVAPMTPEPLQYRQAGLAPTTSTTTTTAAASQRVLVDDNPRRTTGHAKATAAAPAGAAARATTPILQALSEGTTSASSVTSSSSPREPGTGNGSGSAGNDGSSSAGRVVLPYSARAPTAGFLMAPISTIPTIAEVQAAEDAAQAAAAHEVASYDPIKASLQQMSPRHRNSILAAKKKFVEERRRRRKLPKYETKMDLKISTIIEVLLALYFIIWVLIMLPYTVDQMSILQLFALFIPSIAFLSFSISAVRDYTKHKRRRAFQYIKSIVNYLSYYILCCCLCPNVDKPTIGPFETFDDDGNEDNYHYDEAQYTFDSIMDIMSGTEVVSSSSPVSAEMQV